MTPDISVVIPLYNEEGNLQVLYSRLKKVLSSISKSHEIIFIDDGSTDRSLNILKNLRSRDAKIKIVIFSRNFGHIPAINAGLKHSSGKKVVVIDADLQDPPEVIPKLYKKANENFDVVYGVKKKRKEGIIKRSLFSLFYLILTKISDSKMPKNVGTFSIIDRKIVNILNSLPEKNKFFSGLRTWTGSKQVGVSYERDKRFAGKAKTVGKLIRLALDGFISFSYVPLRLASILGFFFAAVAFFFIFVVIIGRVFFGFGIVGWASTMSTILLIGGIQLITLGIIGEYLSRIYDEVKDRPEYIVTKTIGF